MQAEAIYTKEDDGLAQDWFGKVFMNPPFTKNKINLFTEKLIKSYCDGYGYVKEAVVLTESQSAPTWFFALMDAADAFMMRTKRFNYYNASGEIQRGFSTGMLFYFGKNPEGFCKKFRKFGNVWQKK